MEPLKCNWDRLFLVRASKRIALATLIIFIFDVLFFPLPSLAGTKPTNASEEHVRVIVKEEQKDIGSQEPQTKHLPANKSAEEKRSLYVSLTAYSSSIDECQGDPCITANGFNLCRQKQKDTIATNRLPLGTKVQIPELYGDKVFVVRDRMNSRYYNRADIWMETKEEARQFGIKRSVKMVIVE
jgi:3D (Asp-Asp-Asp) domain-containing protein